MFLTDTQANSEQITGKWSQSSVNNAALKQLLSLICKRNCQLATCMWDVDQHGYRFNSLGKVGVEEEGFTLLLLIGIGQDYICVECCSLSRGCQGVLPVSKKAVWGQAFISHSAPYGPGWQLHRQEQGAGTGREERVEHSDTSLYIQHENDPPTETCTTLTHAHWQGLIIAISLSLPPFPFLSFCMGSASLFEPFSLEISTHMMP